jgi:hypothetical protein
MASAPEQIGLLELSVAAAGKSIYRYSCSCC